MAEELKKRDPMKDNQMSISLDKALTGLLVLSLLLNFYLFYQVGVLKQDGTTTGTTIMPTTTMPSVVGEKVKLEFYVMSQCPYGTQVIDAIAPVLEDIGDYVDFNLDYIVTDLGDGKFQSLHGQPEVDGNIAELCAIKYYGEGYQYMDMLVCMDKTASSIPGNWESCATEAGFDVAKLKACYEGDEGKQLLSASSVVAEERQASGSPTIYLNDAKYSGGRAPADFTRAICAAIKGAKPVACENLPQEPEFEVIVLSDERCSDCTPTANNIVAQLTQLFPGMTVKQVDYMDAEGKKLYADTNVEVLPALLFPKTGMQDASNYARIEGYLQPAGAYQTLMIGSQFDPTKEICDNEMDDTNNGKVDCEDADCASTPICSNFEKPTITFFIMSYCPYGNLADEAIEPVYQLLGDKASFEPRYIYYENYRGGGSSYCMDAENIYCSMHGVQEANQNIRENCVQEKYGIGAWFDFTLAMNDACNSQNADTCWQDVASGLGYDTAFIEDCYKNDYEKYAEVDLEMSKSWDASGSPTIFVNGKLYKGARTPEGYKDALCAEFDEMPQECATELADDGAAAPAGSC